MQPGYLSVDPISPPTFLPKARMLHRQNLNVVGIHWTTPQVQTSNIGTAATKTPGKTKAQTLWRYKPLWLLSLSCASPPVCAVVWRCRFFVVSKKKTVPWGSPSKTNLATVSQRFQRNVNVCKCGENMHGCTVCMRLYYLSRAIDCITSVHLCKCWRSTLKAKDCALKCSGWWAI